MDSCSPSPQPLRPGRCWRGLSSLAVAAAPALTDDIRGLKPALEMASSRWLWWLLAFLVAALALAAWLFLRRRKQSPAPAVPPPRPPHERAFAELDAALRLLDEPKLFCTAVSDAIRRYLEDRFHFRAPERTTEEFLEELQDTALLSFEQKQSLGRFLERCDLVKFAGLLPAQTELRDLHKAAVRLVDDTQSAPDPGPVPASESRREAAAP